jgi:hypothetical protein
MFSRNFRDLYKEHGRGWQAEEHPTIATQHGHTHTYAGHSKGKLRTCLNIVLHVHILPFHLHLGLHSSFLVCTTRLFVTIKVTNNILT